MKNLAGSFRLFVNTKEDWDKLSQQLQQTASHAAPEKKHSLFLYIKAVSVGAVCITILLFPLLYFSLHAPDKNIVLKTQEKIAWNQITADQKRTVILQDSSVVTLAKGSTLSYPETFSGNYRMVESTGEVFFQIRHDQQRPFQITTPLAVIKDLGTAFLLRSSDSLQEVIVTEGKVILASRGDSSQTVTLQQGESGSMVINEPVVKKNIATNNLARYTHELRFEHTPLHTVAEDLSLYYHTPVTLSASLRKKKYCFSGHFRHKPLEEVLATIKKELNVDVHKHADSYLLTKENFVQKIIKQLN